MVRRLSALIPTRKENSLGREPITSTNMSMTTIMTTTQTILRAMMEKTMMRLMLLWLTLDALVAHSTPFRHARLKTTLLIKLKSWKKWC